MNELTQGGDVVALRVPEASAASGPQVGDLVGNYRLHGHIDAGSSGTVYRAVDESGQHSGDLAIKLVHTPAEDPDPARPMDSSGPQASAWMRWRREVDALSELMHPGIVRILDAAHLGDLFYIVMELAQGPRLDTLIERGPVDLRTTVDIGVQIADALAAAHGRGLVHRDLKPTNIVVSERADDTRRVKVLDFGLAYKAESGGAPASYGLTGTPLYMAPEQFRDGGRPGAAADLYAFGMILYEMLAAQPPVPLRPISSMQRAKEDGRLAPLGERRPDLPRALVRVIELALQANPDDRYGDARVLRRDLERCGGLLREGRVDFDFPVGVSEEPTSTLGESRLVGRDAELRKLTLLYEGCRQGEGHVALVGGPSGIGKSRLTGELARRVRYLGGLVVQGKCNPATANEPYYGLRAAFGDLADLDDGQGRNEEQRQALNLLLSELGAVHQPAESETPDHADLALNLDPERSKAAFFASIASAVGRLASPGRPLLIVLDDLQWADAGSLELLQRLTARGVPSGLLLIGTLRDGEMKPGSDRQLAVDAIAAQGESITIGPLSEDQVAQLAQEILGAQVQVPPELVTALTEASGGAPFYVRPLVTLLARDARERATREHGEGHSGPLEIDLQRARGLLMGAGREELVIGLIRELTDEQRELLCWLAVGGDFATVPVVAEAANLSQGDVVEGLYACARQGIVEAVTQGSERFIFTHDKFREIMLLGLSRAEQMDRHQAIGEIVEARFSRNEPAVVYALAEHFRQGRDVERALRYCLAAGMLARSASAPEPARRFFQAALLMAKAARTLDAAELENARRLAHEGLGDIFTLTGDHSRALEQFAEAERRLRNDEDRAVVQGKIGSTYLEMGEFHAAARHLQAALRYLGIKSPGNRASVFASILVNALRQATSRGAPKQLSRNKERSLLRMRLRLLNRLGYTTYFFDMERTLQTHLLALAAADRIANSPEASETFAHHGAVAVTVLAPDRAERYALRAIEICESQGFVGQLMQVEYLAGITFTFLGRYEEAEAHFGAAISLFPRVGDVNTLEVSHENLAYSLLYRGEFERALKHAERALSESRGMGDQRGVASSSLHIAISKLRFGDRVAPREHIAEALDLLPKLADSVLCQLIARVAGVVYRELGDHQAAQIQLETAWKICVENRMTQEFAAATPYELAELYLDQWEAQPDKRGLIGGLLRKARAEARRYPGHLGPALRAAARHAALRGRHSAALRLIDQAAVAMEQSGLRYELARTLELQASFLERAKGAERNLAVGARVRAAGLYDGCGAEADADRLRDLLKLARLLPAPVDAAPVDQRTQLLVDAGKALSSLLDIESLLERIMTTVIEITGAERGFVLLAEQPGAELELRSQRGMEPSLVLDLGASAPGAPAYSRTIARSVVASGEPLLVDNALADEQLGVHASVQDLALRSVLCVPLVVKSAPRGVIYLENGTASGMFTSEHLELAESLAAQASVALENAMAYRTIAEMNQDLEAMVERRTRQLEDAQVQMVHQAKMASLGELVAGVAHEIRNPLNFSYNGARTLAKRIRKLETLLDEQLTQDDALARQLEAMSELSEMVLDGSERIKTIVRHLLDFSRGEGGAMVPMNIQQGLDDTLQLTGSAMKDRGVELERDYETLPEIVACPTEVNQVFMNVIMNAVQAIEGEGWIRVSTRTEGDEVVVRVRDSGPGFPEEVLPKAFDPFVSTKDPGEGTGLGLSIAHGIAARHRGRIVARNVGPDEPGGAEIELRLPIAGPGN